MFFKTLRSIKVNYMLQYLFLSRQKLLILTILVLLMPIFSNFYKFYLTKNYNYIIEQNCDDSKNICFIRNCDDDECPPNGLTKYRQFYIKAEDFKLCEDNSCEIECLNGQINCEEIECDVNLGDDCSSLNT